MPYIGKNPVSGGFHKLDALTASATATYALTLNSAAYYPETANHLLVSLNGVIQAPQDSFTVSGSNLVFDTALTTADSIDFVVALGDVLSVGSVTDGAVTTAKLGNGAVTDAKIDTMAATKLTGTIDDARMPAGSVIQIVQGTSNSNILVNGTTFTNTNLSATITPSSTSSKILIEVSTGLDSSSAGNTVIGTIARGSTNLGHSTAGMTHGFSYNVRTIFPASVVYLDSPATTSATTYNFQVRAGGSYNVECPGTSITQVMILKEIAG